MKEVVLQRMLPISSSFQESGQIADSLADGGVKGSAVPQQQPCQDGIGIDDIYINCVSAQEAYKVLKSLRDGPIYPTFNFDALALFKKAEEGEGEDGVKGSAVPQQRPCQDGIEIDGIYIKCVSAQEAYKVLRSLRNGPIYPTFNFDALALLKKAEEGEDNDNSHKLPSIPNVRLLEIRSLEGLLKNSDFHKPIYDSLQGNTSKNIYILTEHSDTVSPFRQICFKISFQDDRSIKFNIVYYFFSGNNSPLTEDIFLIIGQEDNQNSAMSCGYAFATEIFKPTAPR